jgi:uncharacterized protein YecE (DUF72 family)
VVTQVSEIRNGRDTPVGDRVGRVPVGTATCYLGLPLWAHAEWEGSLYRADGRRRTWLNQYASVFNTVEGNTTFYSVPSPQRVARWMEQAPADFRFSFKFPRTITHDNALEAGVDAAHAFLDRLRPLGPRLGPFMLQLPASAGPGIIDGLDRFLESLPSDVRCAVEFRHRRFFEDTAVRQATDEMLQAHGADRVVLDSRPMRSGDMRHPDVVNAEHRKPDLPVLLNPLTRHPVVRFIAHPEPATTEPWLDRWAAYVVRWMLDDREPFFFMHCPNNTHSPALARRFHACLQRRARAAGIDIGPLAPWPGELGAHQLSLM